MNFKRYEKRFTAVFGKCEDYYVLQAPIAAALKDRKKVSPRLFSLLSELLKRENYRMEAEKLTEELAALCKESPLTEEEVTALDHAVALVLLTALATAEASDRESLRENAVYTLRSLTVSPFEKRYLALSLLDRYLTEHHPHYALADRKTKNSIKGDILTVAKKEKISELTAAEGYLAGKYPDSASKKGAIFFFFLAFLSLLLTLSLQLFSLPLPFYLYLLFPIYEAVKLILEEVARRRRPPRPIPSLSLEKIPEGAETVVVITTLFTKKDPSLFHRLEAFYLANREENCRFGLLCDLADAEAPHRPEDEALITYAEDTLEALNQKYANRFFFALRGRAYSESEEVYMGRERKRGALIDLVRFIYREEEPFSHFFGDADFVRKARYLITLDADTDLFMGSVLEMVGAMLYPDNRPIIQNGRVVKGYGVLQPRMAVTTASATATRFSLLLCGSGGVDAYASASFDLYQSFFGEGIFCGKGIIDIEAFHTLIPDAFEEEAILSHDLLEGNLLRAGFLSDLTLTDSFPASPLSWFRRLHRWHRGDLQALPYAASKPKNRSGLRHKNVASPLGRFKLFDNLRRILTPLATTLALLFSLFFDERTQLIVGLTVILTQLVPFLLPLAARPRFTLRRYFSRILTSFGYRFMNLLFSLATLAHMGALSLDAILRSSFRMTVSRKGLLEWTTAAAEDGKKDSAKAYLRETAPSLAVGILLLTFATVSPLRVLALLFLTEPLLLLLLSHRFSSRPRPLSEREKNTLKRYAYDAFSYYVRHITAEDHDLPPDNMQSAPVKAVAHRTSPTNIGMYLLSLLAARDMGFLSSKTLAERLGKTLDTLERMPKKRGHLYNWYDTRTLALLGDPFVSTVDSGNLVTALLTLAKGLEDYTEEEPTLRRLARRIDRLVEETDFSYLYCKERELFYIARSTEEPSPLSCYDLYMSECRTTSYYAVAIGTVPKKHWSRLSRPAVGRLGYTGLASWSGTAFEYFMPHLLLPVLPGSLTEEALSFAVSCQKKEGILGVFGISESAYCGFDADMNYQYRAHGIGRLALDSHIGNTPVISPYSAFLMLKSAPHTALACLERLEKMGMYGEHGFYEALDFTVPEVGKAATVIKSYMAHHVGMSIVATANACLDNIFVKRFMSDPRMASAKELLEERIPTGVPLFRGKIPLPEAAKTVKRLPVSEEKKHPSEKRKDRIPTVALLSGAGLTLRISSSGDAALTRGPLAVTYPVFEASPSPTGSIRLFFSHGKESYTMTPDGFSYSGTKAVFTMTRGKLHAKASFTLHGERELFLVSFQLSGATESVSVALMLQPILTTAAAFFSHPFYDALSVEASYCEDEDILYFHKRKKEDSDEVFLALSLSGEGETVFSTRKDILPYGYGESDLLALVLKPLPCDVGATVSPLALVRKTVTPHLGKVSLLFFVSPGRTKEEARAHILALKGKPNPFDAAAESLRPRLRRILRRLGADRPHIRYAELYLSAVTYPQGQPTHPDTAALPLLWKGSISGDRPIVALSLKEATELFLHTVTLFLRTHRLLRQKGFVTDLVLIAEESDPYRRPVEKALRRLLSAEGEEAYLSRPGGVFLTADPEVKQAVIAASSLYLPLEKDTAPEELYYSLLRQRLEKRPTPVTHPEEEQEPTEVKSTLTLKGGYFRETDFTVVKKEAEGIRSHVLASPRFGTLLTASSMGYTWLQNAKESRLTEPSRNTHREESEEYALAEGEGKLFDLAAMATSVTFSPDRAVYRGRLAGKPYRLEVGIDLTLPVKLILAELPEGYRLRYEVSPSFGVAPHLAHTTVKGKEGKSTFFENSLSPHLSAFRIFLSPLEEEKGKQGCLFGIYPRNAERVYHLIRSRYHSPSAIEKGFEDASLFYHRLFSPLRFHLPRTDFELLMNRFVPYQTLAARIFGRTGYHQSGGAYGFRDQLQDALSLLYFNEGIAKRQILRAAARQYKEGDVQHWWHIFPDHTRAGLRTRISDDMLWLPYAVATYCRVSGDFPILETLIPYLDSPPLGPEEKDRYESPPYTAHKESLYHHCMRAIDAACRFSPRGLALMGSGDWNDAFDRVGREGKGESVFLTRFLSLVLREFLPIVAKVGDKAAYTLQTHRIAALDKAAETYAFTGDRYLRATYDSGEPMGVEEAEACKIDSLSQSFSALAKGKTERTLTALSTAYRHLYLPKAKLFALFSPPFGGEDSKTGYVSAYCEGIRENGGQYNHGTLFAARGYFAVGEKEKGFSLLEAVNPITRSLDPDLAQAYRSEPYALCGDIYTCQEHMGRGGWSLYTGAAGWFFRTVLEDLLGYREYPTYFTLTPSLTAKMPCFSMKVYRKNTFYRISVTLADEETFTLDGKRYRPEEKTPRFFFDGRRHNLEMDIEKEEKL